MRTRLIPNARRPSWPRAIRRSQPAATARRSLGGTIIPASPITSAEFPLSACDPGNAAGHRLSQNIRPRVQVHLISRGLRSVDLVVIGSDCIGLGLVSQRFQTEGLSLKVLTFGSTGGLSAAKRGECDIAPIHLMDSDTGEYNRPFLTSDLELAFGYLRLQRRRVPA